MTSKIGFMRKKNTYSYFPKTLPFSNKRQLKSYYDNDVLDSTPLMNAKYWTVIYYSCPEM